MSTVVERIRQAVADRGSTPEPAETLRQLTAEVLSLRREIQHGREPAAEDPATVLTELQAMNARLGRLERGSARAEKRLLSQRQAAKVLGIGRDTLSQLVAAKKVHTSRVNGQRRIPLAEVERLIRDGFSSESAPQVVPRRTRGKGAKASASILDFNPNRSRAVIERLPDPTHEREPVELCEVPAP